MLPSNRVTRRQLSAALVGLTAKAERRIAGGFADSSPHLLGHRLRDNQAAFAMPGRRVKAPVVIVGGGVAGLSAGWWLARRGFHDFVILEMEAQAGGNSRWGEGEAGAYPWAAHYVPVPGKNATLVRELFEELGVLLPNGEFEERHLCHTPQERLFLHGRWQEGLEPEIGATRRDHDEYKRFNARMAEFAASGEFRIPRDSGARRRLDLDALTMAEWLGREGFTSEYLTLDRWPREQRGAPMAWDNVLYRSPALGYVVSTHQSLRQHVDRTVWTYYWALADGRPAEVRKQLLERDWGYWKEAVLADLERAHPDIRECVTRVDVMRFGHAMARPTPGFLSAQVGPATGADGTLLLANSDLSGFSIFEEAQYRGVEAARAALTRLGRG